jgi:hypothetical protein
MRALVAQAAPRKHAEYFGKIKTIINSPKKKYARREPNFWKNAQNQKLLLIFCIYISHG